MRGRGASERSSVRFKLSFVREVLDWESWRRGCEAKPYLTFSQVWDDKDRMLGGTRLFSISGSDRNSKGARSTPRSFILNPKP